MCQNKLFSKPYERLGAQNTPLMLMMVLYRPAKPTLYFDIYFTFVAGGSLPSSGERSNRQCDQN